jgi:hypothetical protein
MKVKRLSGAPINQTRLVVLVAAAAKLVTVASASRLASMAAWLQGGVYVETQPLV